MDWKFLTEKNYQILSLGGACFTHSYFYRELFEIFFLFVLLSHTTDFYKMK